MPAGLIDAVPDAVALHYAVLPVRLEDHKLVLGCESYLDPVSLAAISRKLGRSVRYVIVPKGQVTIGLRLWYGDSEDRQVQDEFEAAARKTGLSPQAADLMWNVYVGGQLILGDILCALGRIDPAALNSVLIQRAKDHTRLGEFMVSRGLLAQAALDEALALQQELQLSMRELLRSTSLWRRVGSGPLATEA